MSEIQLTDSKKLGSSPWKYNLQLCPQQNFRNSGGLVKNFFFAGTSRLQSENCVARFCCKGVTFKEGDSMSLILNLGVYESI